MNISINKITSILVAGTIAALLTGCSVPAAPQEDPKAASAEKPNSSKPSPTEENPMLKNFGEVVTYTDGVSISVSEGVEYTPTENAWGSVEGQTSLVFKLVLTNNTSEPFQPTTVSSATSGGAEATFIADTEHPEYGDIGTTPQTMILPGKSIEWTEAYSVKDVNDITFQIVPALQYKDALFVTQK